PGVPRFQNQLTVSSEVTSESRGMQASKFTVKTLSRVIPKSEPAIAASDEPQGRLRELTHELHQLEQRLRAGGGPDKIEKQHKQGKLTARERIDLLLDRDSYQQEIGLLVAYDQYKAGDRSQETGVRRNEDEVGQAPGAGVVTTVGRVAGRE